MVQKDKTHKITNSGLIKRGFKFQSSPYNTWVKTLYGYHCRWRYEFKDLKCTDYLHKGVSFHWDNIDTLEKMDQKLGIILNSI